MELTGQSVRTVAALSTVGALALAPIAIAPPDLHTRSIAAARISTEAVQLTDAWSDLLTNTVGNTIQLAGLFIGLDSGSPLPNPIFIAPVATQLILNQLIYAVQLFTGKGAEIPVEISTHLDKIGNLIQGISNDVPGVIVDQIQTPFKALQLALDSITTSGNPLLALLEAPAVFLDAALNSQYGILGPSGPIALPILIRNFLAEAISTPLPTITLPFKKADGAAAKTVTPKAAAVTTPSGTASSARTKPKSPSTGSVSAKKTGAAKAGSARSGVGHGKR
ncbi:conserved exported hypothetical protein [uncultured Mycobacterium sp.]|uniref:Uncharacterized protein n=1 Tax=uncultured Mycobacterium sp. TaxID=171292 RepID=A0A1Y5PNA0_9MYCO|nr:conserved exported hypothetical protein [uncultured Mycobacterium sp.]